MMAELDIEGNEMTALEVPVPTNDDDDDDDDSSSVSHSRTSNDDSISEPSSSKSDSDTTDPTSSLPSPFKSGKLDIPREDLNVKVPRATQFNRQNSLPPMLPPQVPRNVPKKDPRRGHQQQQRLQQHFLHGINVESCQNLLSIPDPPTPGKVNRRRQSSPGPLLQPLPFDDLTHSSKVNQQNNHADDSKVALRSKSKSKRPRKSFSHLPSPVPTDFGPVLHRRRGNDNYDTGTGIQERAATETEAESSYEAFDSLQVADDYTEKSDADDASVTKRRKKRQSIVLSSDTTTGTQEYFSTFMTYKKAPPTAPKEAQPSPTLATALPVASMEQRPTAVNSQDLQELRKLVRSYTSLPLGSRNNCQELQAIRERTGYVLTPPLICLDEILHVDPNLDDSDHEQQQHQQGKQSLKASKMNLLVQMGPQLQYMDEKKVEQIQNSQHATACFVEKKRGRYMYYDVSSNRPIPPDEYEQRYLLMLQDIHKIRSQEWAQHFRQVAVPAATVAAVEEQTLDFKSIIENENKYENGQESPLEMRDDVNDKCYDDDGNLHESMDICETSASFVMGEEDLEDELTEKNPYDNCNTSSSSKGGDEGQEIVLDEQGEFRNIPYGMDGMVASPGSDGESSVLPLPSRDEESSDPEFAQAEQKLWTSIDHALEEYSRDILAIQTARRMRTPSKVST